MTCNNKKRLASTAGFGGDESPGFQYLQDSELKKRTKLFRNKETSLTLQLAIKRGHEDSDSEEELIKRFKSLNCNLKTKETVNADDITNNLENVGKSFQMIKNENNLKPSLQQNSLECPSDEDISESDDDSDNYVYHYNIHTALIKKYFKPQEEKQNVYESSKKSSV